MVQPTKDGPRFDAPRALNDPSNRRILTLMKDAFGLRCSTPCVRHQDVAKVLLVYHNNIFEAFSADRADRSLHISVLPG
jgi:hypothetical protein